MTFLIRPMALQDVPQVDNIEREAFPTQWPPTSYKWELQNKVAHYLVAYEVGRFFHPPQPPLQGEGLLSRLKGLFNRKRGNPQNPPLQFLVGMVGFWMLYDEAHITTIAVRKACRRQGLGELMVIVAIEQAIKLGARVMTLEVRVSNFTAQALYEKYGFRKVGLRRGYYTDNGEDGYIMTTDPLTSAPFQTNFQQLREIHTQKWGHKQGEAQKLSDSR